MGKSWFELYCPICGRLYSPRLWLKSSDSFDLVKKPFGLEKRSGGRAHLETVGAVEFEDGLVRFPVIFKTIKRRLINALIRWKHLLNREDLELLGVLFPERVEVEGEGSYRVGGKLIIEPSSFLFVVGEGVLRSQVSSSPARLRVERKSRDTEKVTRLEGYSFKSEFRRG